MNQFSGEFSDIYKMNKNVNPPPPGVQGNFFQLLILFTQQSKTQKIFSLPWYKTEQQQILTY